MGCSGSVHAVDPRLRTQFTKVVPEGFGANVTDYEAKRKRCISSSSSSTGNTDVPRQPSFYHLNRTRGESRCKGPETLDSDGADVRLSDECVTSIASILPGQSESCLPNLKEDDKSRRYHTNASLRMRSSVSQPPFKMNEDVIDEPVGSCSLKSFFHEPDQQELNSGSAIAPCAPLHHSHVRRIQRAMKLVGTNPNGFEKHIMKSRAQFDDCIPQSLESVDMSKSSVRRPDIYLD
jgi:hypothetical protein